MSGGLLLAVVFVVLALPHVGHHAGEPVGTLITAAALPLDGQRPVGTRTTRTVRLHAATAVQRTTIEDSIAPSTTGIGTGIPVVV